jgi:hypothetical protein
MIIKTRILTTILLFELLLGETKCSVKINEKCLTKSLKPYRKGYDMIHLKETL